MPGRQDDAEHERGRQSGGRNVHGGLHSKVRFGKLTGNSNVPKPLRSDADNVAQGVRAALDLLGKP